MKNVIFRVDSSFSMGSGHLMRCLTLANGLKKKANIIFICRDLENNLNFLVKSNGFELYELPRVSSNAFLTGYLKWLTVEQDFDAKQTRGILQDKNVDWLIVDNYAIDEEWEKDVRPFVKNIMVIDDLANRKHDCDILLDQNYYKNMKKRYGGRVPSKCTLLLGPKYALLRNEFQEANKRARERDSVIKNILVFFGGSDVTNETIKALCAIEQLQRGDITVNVVVGGSNANKKQIAEICGRYDYMNYFCQINSMAILMNEADIALGAGGSTTWERCYLGLPAIVIAIAENQLQISQDCAELGIIEYLGKHNEVDAGKIESALVKMITNQGYYQSFIKATRNIVDGLGISRIADELLKEKRKCSEESV